MGVGAHYDSMGDEAAGGTEPGISRGSDGGKEGSDG
jgi:hypothetical protein